MKIMAHIPVLLNEVIKFLEPKPGDVILDATIGGGGHAREILKRILPNGKLIGIDQDATLISNLKSLPADAAHQKNLILINGNFRNLDKLLEPLKISAKGGSASGGKKLDAVLCDLGMNSLQLEESGRGFTFLKNEPLIMTYKFPASPDDLTAEKILNTWPEKDIAEVLFRWGEERYARRIAKKIIETRRKKSFKTTFELVEAILKSVPRRHYYKINPATKTFQALRIAVNDELNALSEVLEKAWRLLVPGSRLVVISFHSLEDRIVKNFLKNKAKEGTAEVKTKKPIRPSIEEIRFNPKSRSAKLRAAIKI